MKNILSLNPALAESMLIWLIVSTGITVIVFLMVWLWKRRK
ncbi:hypothetical protein RA086_06590 [Lactiplantibacillus sp. WILCCON 0030]|uniref:LPXTG cell wall anchor domain-containing protein n=1 Tax=Lactiplantibacillus brownii TaxID=3069269 RepID=A0ABU1A8K5_9LACO|nr:hypothetical protein [Lactiplantibacillus brownii]MDQ7937294.1 hypothetical protein [Lactiplantibacillus brownii]